MRLLLISIWFVLLAQSAPAQYLRGYVFAAPTPNNSIYSAPPPPSSNFGILPTSPAPTTVPGSTEAATGGAGLEYRVYKYYGAGLDVAGIFPGSGKVIGNAVGTVSSSAYLHAPRAAVDLYAVGGYTLLFQDHTGNGVNAGGGLNYWFHDRDYGRLGGMFEFRFVRVLGSNPPTPAAHYYEIRLGLTFR